MLALNLSASFRKVFYQSLLFFCKKVYFLDFLIKVKKKLSIKNFHLFRKFVSELLIFLIVCSFLYGTKSLFQAFGAFDCSISYFFI